MKPPTPGIAALLAIMAVALVNPCAQTLCTWRHDASAAVSLTFDDGIADQISVGAPALERNGWFGTFFLVTLWTPNLAPWKTLADKGHEIGAHATAHQDYTTLTASAAKSDILACNSALESGIGRKVVSFAYPYCAVGGSETIVKKYYIAARSCNTSINSGSAVFPERSQPTNMWALGSATTGSFIADSAAKAVSRTMASKGWLIELFHELSSIRPEFVKHVAYLATNGDRVFVAPFGHVARYISERLGARIATVTKSAGEWRLSLTDTLDDAVYNTALTVKVALPAEWTDVRVAQAGGTVWSAQTGTTLLFDAVPDKGEILITPAGTRVMPPRGSVGPRECTGAAITYSMSGSRLRHASPRPAAQILFTAQGHALRVSVPLRTTNVRHVPAPG